MYISKYILDIKLKILIVSSYFGKIIGGALNFIKELSEELSSRGHSVNLLLDDRYKGLFSVDGVNIIWFSSTKITAYSPSVSFMKIISKIDADVIHLHGYMSFQTDLGALIGLLRKIPVILTPHGSLLGYDYLYESSKSKISYYFHDVLTMKLPTKFSKYVIATSQAEFKDCQRFGIPIDKIKLIPLSFSFTSNSKLKEKQTIKTRLLFVGRIVPLKNLDVLLNSVKIIKKNIQDIEFVIVGDEVPGRLKGDTGYKKHLVSLVETLGIKENVKFVGWETGQKLWDIYQKSDLFLLASTYENFGRPLLEAAHFGLPLVSVDVGVARDLIRDDQGGIMISRLDAEEFAKKIIGLLKDNSKYNKSSKYVQDQSQEFSIKLIADKYEQIFLEVVKK